MAATTASLLAPCNRRARKRPGLGSPEGLNLLEEKPDLAFTHFLVSKEQGKVLPFAQAPAGGFTSPYLPLNLYSRQEGTPGDCSCGQGDRHPVAPI
ncbi:unnamed protein product [Rangifer tarandus platyrhynchus]|uniref:Uncharacterized protein n=2 Tax=Rangifer tarandus platyrhynchus TaxID=3082113 RepID=A0ACB0EKC8_RANTA|nr:unnamed protein product [Rangifer tarandus platyrhynchus]CAI9700939.1 unnamed protein product [Rangifer tarandus platyrhynchus]